MSYEEIQNYLQHLIDQSGTLPQGVQIDPRFIHPSEIKAIEHSKLAGLQAADAIASSMHFAVKRNIYGESEPAYSRLLTKTFYRHKSTLLGYGVKLWPDSLDTVQTKAPEVKNLEGL